VLGYVSEIWKHILHVGHDLEYVAEVSVYDNDSDKKDWVTLATVTRKNAIEIIRPTTITVSMRPRAAGTRASGYNTLA